MSNDETKKNVDAKGSLMKHTKAQLVDIILRKDSVEQELREKLKNNEKSYIAMYNDFHRLNAKFAHLEEVHEVLKNDYQNECDEHSTTYWKYKDKVNRYKVMFFIVLFIALIIGIYLFV